MHRYATVSSLGSFFMLVTIMLLGLAIVGSSAYGARSLASPVGATEASQVRGGGCGSACAPRRGGGGGGGGGRDSSTDPVGSPYWTTTEQRVRSVDPGVAVRIDHVTNRDTQPLDHQFSYEQTTVRNIGFSGGYASHFRASIGGETRRTVTRRMTKRVDPWTALKIYTRLETTRYQITGTKYQDLAGGGRRVVERATGPYTTALTRIGYVSSPLR